METPLGLSNRLQEFAIKAKDGKELFEQIIKLPNKEIIEFFECAADDQTWVDEKGGEDFMSYMIPFLTKANLTNTIPKDLLESATHSIQRNIRFLFYYLPEDIGFIVQGQKYVVNSLLFRFVCGDYFSSLIDDYVIARKQPDVELKGVKARVFIYLKEYVYTGKMENLWREDPKVILSLQKRANQWGMKELSDTAFRTFKNYISKEVLFQRLLIAFEQKNIHMTRELLEELKKEDLGFTLEVFRETGFKLTLNKLNEEMEPLLNPFVPYVYSLHFTGTLEEEPLKRLLKKCDRLEFLDLSPLKGFQDSLGLIQSIPARLPVLNLHDLPWVNEQVLDALLTQCPNLNQLDLSGCEGFPTTYLTELSRIRTLEKLCLNRLPDINDSNLNIIVPVWRAMVLDFEVSECPKLDDKCLVIIMTFLRQLRELNISGCRNLTLEGILQLSTCKTLRKLDLRNIPSIPPNFKEKHGFRFFNVDLLLN